MGDRFGEVSERFKEPVLKTGDSVMGHGFESHPLRHTTLKQNGDHQFCLMEKYSSGRRGAPAKGVGVLKRARVQIPPSPPRNHRKPFLGQPVAAIVRIIFDSHFFVFFRFSLFFCPERWYNYKKR